MALLISLFATLNFALSTEAEINNLMVRVPGGDYIPFYPKKSKDSQQTLKPVHVKSFLMDIYPVTNADFKKFLIKNVNWRRSKVKRIFADNYYLQNWKGDLMYSAKSQKAPVTFVSWFAANAYCDSKGKRLPTIDQWEYAAFDNGRFESKTKERTLAWYSEPNQKIISEVGSTEKNGYGIYDLLGLIWEWTYDFNSPMGGDANAFCGGSATDAKDSKDYINFMRFAFRASLKASYTTANLGFRCIKEVSDEK